jgi:hypothetical protein
MDYQESGMVLTVFRIMQQNKIQSLNGMPEHATKQNTISKWHARACKEKKKGKELKKMS